MNQHISMMLVCVLLYVVSPDRAHSCITLLCLQLAKQGALNLKTIRHFIIDECDKVLENIGEDKSVIRCGCIV